jgi:hypothetical protein
MDTRFVIPDVRTANWCLLLNVSLIKRLFVFLIFICVVKTCKDIMKYKVNTVCCVFKAGVLCSPGFMLAKYVINI